MGMSSIYIRTLAGIAGETQKANDKRRNNGSSPAANPNQSITLLSSMATEGDPCAECLVDCCGMMCAEACCCCIQTECCGAGDDACCCAVTVLSALALAALVAVLVVAYAVVFPVHVSVNDALLGRLALADAANGTAQLAYDVALAVAVRNRNRAVGVRRTAPLDTELRFRGQTFARAWLAGAEPGRIPAMATAVYRVAASADRGALPVALGDDGVAQFVRESVAGEFELELVVVGEVKYEGHPHRRGVRATCPLKLSLSTATAPAAFTRVKCTT
ncbi:hypothetical protein U9M48_030496 [Paspalum notatum var. saurae]|uniref:Late embryogenesis abundant protein LEA-2 subgroup domain-containing protein n=1 Tax=Paspalum notatum var. saurae TaxID=547442 RepID=A0AAQ3X3B4_PASNO